MLRNPDWGGGIPSEVRGEIFKQLPGGPDAKKFVRSVCKGWQASHEGIVRKVKFTHGAEAAAPFPPDGPSLQQRFPSLTCLDLGESRAVATDLGRFAGCPPTLQSLVLGARRSRPANLPIYLFQDWDNQLPPLPQRTALFRRLKSEGLQHLPRIGPIASLDLGGCERLTDAGVQHLLGLSGTLTQLRLSNNKALTNAALQSLSGLTLLRNLRVEYCQKVTPEGLRHLQGLPLVSFSPRGCLKMTDAAVEVLREFVTLEHLSLAQCATLTRTALGPLGRDPPPPALTNLDLSGIGNLDDESILLDLARETPPPLTQLALDDCVRISGDGIAALRRLTRLVDLSLTNCKEAGNGGLVALRGLPLTSLNLDACIKLELSSADVQACLGSFQLTALSIRKCRLAQRSAFPCLAGMPLVRLSLRGIGYGATDEILGRLRGKQLRELDLRGSHQITDEGLKVYFTFEYICDIQSAWHGVEPQYSLITSDA